MRNAGLEEAQAGIKIARRHINNLRYADDTTLMAESEEELKSLLLKVKEESLLGSQDGNGRQNAESISGQEDDVLGIGALGNGADDPSLPSVSVSRRQGRAGEMVQKAEHCITT